ncbi:MAG: undecaprenyl-diphosphate phosphatase [SAR324 cluster bacterium]|nr:undecaprenyl-diphosphate phosphatase [SAR324 cluster bacterium]
MDLIQAFVLGVVQGFSEFLPISSTAHLRIVPHILGWPDPGTEFSAIIQLGTLIAVIIYFRHDVWHLSKAAIESILKREPMRTADSRMAWSIAVGTIPVVVLGLVFKDFIKNEIRELWVIGSALIVLAIFLFLAEKLSPRNRDIKQLSFVQVQLIGLTQALALIPGCSRSGSTIMGGLIVGLNREAAARFSFLLGLPAIFGSGLYELKELIEIGISIDHYLNLAVGITTAFVTGYISIDFLLHFIRNHGTLVFVIYRILIGTGILIFLV